MKNEISLLGFNAMIFIRNAYRNKTVFLINTVGLALSFAFFIVISLWVKNAYSMDKQTVNKESTYRLIVGKIYANETIKTPYLPAVVADILRNEFPQVKKVGRISKQALESFRFDKDKIFRLNLYLADKEIFDILNIKILKGNPIDSSFIQINSIAISDELAIKIFGTIDIIGKEVRLDAFPKNILRITNVFEKPKNSHLDIDFVLTYANFPHTGHAVSQDFNLFGWNDNIYVQLQVNIQKEEFEKKLSNYITSLKLIKGFETNFYLQPLSEIYLKSDFEYDNVKQGNIKHVYIFSLLAVLILIISCINYVNITIAYANRRAREIGLKKVVGVRRYQLIRQQLFESILSVFIAFALALLLVEMILPLANLVFAEEISLGAWQNSSYIIGVLAFVLFIGILSGIFPAFIISSYKPVQVLYGSVYTGKTNYLFRDMLIFVQFAISIALILSTLIVYKQIQFIKNMETGINRKDIIGIAMTDARKFQTMKQELIERQDIKSVSAGLNSPIFLVNYTSNIGWEGKSPDNNRVFYFDIVSFDFVETFNIKVLKGRSFQENYPSDRVNSFLINEEAAKAMDLEDPVGKEISFNDHKGVIIGVVKNFNFKTFKTAIEPLVLAIGDDMFEMFIKFKPTKSKQVLDIVRPVWQNMMNDKSFNYYFIEDKFNSFYRSEMLLGKLLIYFAVFALFIANLGTFGLVSYMAQNRIKEIGIRKVFGSSSNKIVYMFLRKYLILLSVASLIIVPLVIYILQKWLNNFSYRISITADIVLFALIPLYIITLATVVINSKSAANLNPARALTRE
jgi:ABC-type antimicrobial peptide transport system permease subunit